MRCFRQFFYTPTWLVIVIQVIWQASHGAASFVYLFFNPDLRRAVFDKMFKSDSTITITTVNPSQKTIFQKA